MQSSFSLGLALGQLEGQTLECVAQLIRAEGSSCVEAPLLILQLRDVPPLLSALLHNCFPLLFKPLPGQPLLPKELHPLPPQRALRLRHRRRQRGRGKRRADLPTHHIHPLPALPPRRRSWACGSQRQAVQCEVLQHSQPDKVYDGRTVREVQNGPTLHRPLLQHLSGDDLLLHHRPLGGCGVGSLSASDSAGGRGHSCWGGGLIPLSRGGPSFGGGAVHWRQRIRHRRLLWNLLRDGLHLDRHHGVRAGDPLQLLHEGLAQFAGGRGPRGCPEAGQGVLQHSQQSTGLGRPKAQPAAELQAVQQQ
eukprot:RCo009071